jgi:hypothetical protein
MSGALAGLAILALGDSHMLHMITPLYEAMQAEGAVVTAYGMCGATPEDWLSRVTTQCLAERQDKEPLVVKNQPQPTWLLTELLDHDRPNLVVIELGDNLAGYGATASLPRDLIAQQVKAFIAPITARHVACVWVGPPFGNDTQAYHKSDTRVRELSQFLAQNVAPCSYLDTTSLAGPGQWSTVDGELLPAVESRHYPCGRAAARQPAHGGHPLTGRSSHGKRGAEFTPTAGRPIGGPTAAA